MRPSFAYLAFLLLSAACCKQEEPTYSPTGKLRVYFVHTVKSYPLQMDTMLYRTSQGHDYKVTDLQYFVSGIVLYHDGGSMLQTGSDGGIHYVDARDAGTLLWEIKDGIPRGTYDSVAFTFGIDAAKNTTGRFPDPPERDMAWPSILGGGYHYMKMNMMYRSSAGSLPEPFMFHLGIGQLYASSVPDPDSITGFVQNFFTVTLPVKVPVVAGQAQVLQVTMHVERWFDGEETFNFDDYPNGIMQYQDGMHKACINGKSAFSGFVPLPDIK